MARIFRMNQILVDTGIIYALADEDDEWHPRVVDFVLGYKGRLIVPSPVIPEACYLLNKNLGVHAEMEFLGAIVKREFFLEYVSPEDLGRCLEVMEQYRDANIGVVNASLVSIAERLELSRLLTTDRRHFSIIHPKHCDSFELLP